MLSVFIALVAIIASLLYFHSRRNLNFFKKNNVVHFKADPIWGHFKDLIFMKTSPADVISKIYNHKEFKGQPYGGVFIMQKPGIFVKDIDLIKRIMITDSNKFNDHYADTHQGDTIGINNMFLAKGNRWRQIRRKMVQAYTSGRMKSMFHLIDEVGNQLDKHLLALSIDNKESCKAIKPISSLYTTDVIASTALGVEANSLNNPNAEFYNKGKVIFEFDFLRAIEFNTIFFLPKLAYIIKAKLFGKKADNFLKGIYHFVVEERMKSGIYRNDLIDILVELKKENSSENCDYLFTDDALLSQAATFFSAGFETTSQTMSFALYELAKHPQIQSRLREEIGSVLQKTNGKITYDVINEMEYLGIVLKETLRLYPVLPYLDRVATLEESEEFSLEPFGNFKIKNGMPVFIPVYAIHKDPKYFPEPEIFDPERFSPENRANIQSGTYFPFGNGPRTCIGERFALMSGKVGLFYYLKNHSFRINEKSHKEMKLSKSALLLQAEGEIL
ncbi:Cyp6g1.2 family protein [Megaselia abdita]